MASDSDDTAAMIERVCRLPLESLERPNLTEAQLLTEAGYFERRDELTADAVLKLLRVNPDFVEAWIGYSANKRTSSGWYFRDCRLGGYHRSPPVSDFELGRMEDGLRFPFSDAATGCADFVVRELQSRALPRGIHEREGAPHAAVFHLCPQPPIVRGWIYVLGTIFITMVSAEVLGIPMFIVFSDGPAGVVPGIAASIAGAACGLWLMLRLRKGAIEPVRPVPLQVEATGIRLPATYRSKREVWIPFENLKRLRVAGRSGQPHLFIRARVRVFIFPAEAFVEPNAPEGVLDEVRRVLGDRRPDLLQWM